jgi:thiol-disulfide isomerase/thioredoxin
MRWRVFLLALAAAAVHAENLQPRPLPATPIYTLDGKKIQPKTDYRGKVVLVFMFSTQCPHCQETAQWLSRVQKDLGPQGVQIIGVAFDEDAKIQLPAFIARYRPTYPTGYMDIYEGLKYAVIPEGARPTVPFFLFVDRTGIIRAQFTGADELLTKNSERATRGFLAQMLKNARPVGRAPDQTKSLPPSK